MIFTVILGNSFYVSTTGTGETLFDKNWVNWIGPMGSSCRTEKPVAWRRAMSAGWVDIAV